MLRQHPTTPATLGHSHDEPGQLSLSPRPAAKAPTVLTYHDNRALATERQSEAMILPSNKLSEQPKAVDDQTGAISPSKNSAEHQSVPNQLALNQKGMASFTQMETNPTSTLTDSATISVQNLAELQGHPERATTTEMTADTEHKLEEDTADQKPPGDIDPSSGPSDSSF